MPQQPRWEMVEQPGNVPAAGRAQGDVTEPGDAHAATRGCEQERYLRAGEVLQVHLESDRQHTGEKPRSTDYFESAAIQK